MTSDDLSLRGKLLIGLDLSYNRLIEQKQKENGNLIFSKNGKIVKVKARKLNNRNVSESSSIGLI